jgi:TolA-binding protein
MSMHEETGQKPGQPGLRRRIVVELTPQELPLFEKAEAAHGSKRQAFLAALAALDQAAEMEAELAGLRAQAEKSERATAGTSSKEKNDSKRQKARLEKLERELKAAKAKLAARERDLSSSAEQRSAIRRLEEELAETEEELEEREEEVTELSERAFDHLFCPRCESWAPPEEWAWQRAEEGGRIAYHKPCGAHGPGLMSNATWLGYRAG